MKYTILILICLFSISVSAQTIAEEILQQNRNMEQAYNDGNLVEIANYYTKEAVIVGPGTEVIGNKAIVAYWKSLEGKNVKWELENVEITTYRDVVIQRGISHLHYYYEDTIVQSDVRFTLVWIQENNQWKISIDHYSPL
tara:strand:- start:8004 stop:8423 length:420 start_codon:yes stop_codon:yes gene_type:complete